MSESPDLITQAASARGLIRSQESGVLSTISKQLAGYPFGSITPYVMTHTGEIAVLVSSIAAHTANMRADPKVCLTVTQEGDGNSQALGRVTLVGDAMLVPEESIPGVQERYFGLFPAAREYGQAHDFAFYWIEPKRVRYIAGFGQIFWVEPEDWRLPTPDWAGSEAGVIEHMNSDHASSVRAIGERHGLVAADEAQMVAVDVEGCHIQAESRRVYAPFEGLAHTADELRQAMIALAKAV